MSELIILAFVVLGFWLVSDSLKAREAAHHAARKACEAESVQFLDDTVSQSNMRLARDAEGRLKIERRFSFEFSSTGDDREKGFVRLLSSQVQEVRLARLWLVD